MVSEDQVGPVAYEKVRDPWVEQLARAVQQLSWRLGQGRVTDHEPGITVVDDGQRSPKTERREGRPYGQGGPTKSRETRDQRCFCGREGHLPEIAIRPSSQGHRDPLDPGGER